MLRLVSGAVIKKRDGTEAVSPLHVAVRLWAARRRSLKLGCGETKRRGRPVPGFDLAGETAGGLRAGRMEAIRFGSCSSCRDLGAWMKRGLIGLLILCGFAGTLRAHDPGISTAEGVVSAGRIELKTGFAPTDVEWLLPPALRTGERWTETEFAAAERELLRIAPQWWEARSGERTLAVETVAAELAPQDAVNLSVKIAWDGRAPLTLRATRLDELPAPHRQFVMIFDERGALILKKLISARDPTLEIPARSAVATAGANESAAAVPASAGDAPTFRGFLWLGVEHIWMGYDHLLFLFALLVVCRTFRSIVAIITCFTLAHSLTLVVATLGWVALPSRWVEPAIALSIVFVGAENLWRRGEEPRGRWLLTFGFGLIHGFGFAGVLRELGVSASGEAGVALPLLAFNLGVELGQVAIAAVVMPLLWQLRRRERFVRLAVPALSSLVVVAGLYWLAERTIFA